ncbi:MAG: tetratricopeptide repeat protein [Ardenticatenaceae bacterium]|nr:tetratricopeptide repeat protein [Ardenticatenaceae bacterium]
MTTYETALAILRELGNRAGEGTTLNNIGLVYKSQGRYELALTTYEVALAIRREVRDRAGEGTTLNNIAGVYQSQGRYEEALRTYEEALAIRREVRDRAGEWAILYSLGLVYKAQGQYELALTIYETALTITREVGDQAGEWTILNNIAGVYYSQGRHEAALTTYEEALIFVREVGDQAGEGTILNNIAEVYNSQEQYEAALTTFEVALAISRIVGDRVGEGATLSNIATVYDAQGQYEAALTAYEEALAITREVGDRGIEAYTLNNIAGIYQLQGRYEAALTTYKEALAIRRDVGDRTGEGTTLNNIGLLYHAQGQSLEAMAYYEQAVVIFDSIRAISGNDSSRASFIAQYASLYHRLLDVYVEEDLLMEAFLTSEQGRTRSFSDVLATGVVQFEDNEPAASLITAANEAYAALIAAQDALARARAFNPPDPELVADLEAQRIAAETAYDEALAALDALDESLEELVPGRLAVSDLAEVQRLLNEQTTLVSFWVLEDRTIAFVVTPDDFEVVTINLDAATLTTQVLAFLDFAEIESAHPSTAVNLHDTLIAPLQPYLHTPHLVIVPHQILNYLPFAALTDGEKYLMDQFTITYLPSASTLKYLPDVADAPSYETALVLGNPATGNTDEFGEVLSNLPYAAQSAETIAGLFGTTALVGEAATETAVRTQISSANILHLGAHGRYNTVAPMQSLIYLAGDAEGDVDANGHLRVGEVYSLSIDRDKMELVVLSACQTNLGDIDREDPLANISAGDELVSLNRAFLFQSPTVISTLWTVDDAATSLLMEQFYTYLLNGNSKADALRLAQLYVRDYRDGEYAHPYYWAGFVLSGDGGEIDPNLIHPASASVTDEIMETDMTPTPAEGTETAVSEPTVSTDTNNEGNSRPALVIGIGAILLLLFAALAINRRKRAEI